MASKISFSPFWAVTTAAASTLAVFYAVYSLVPLVWAGVPGASSLFLGSMMFFVLAVQVFIPALVRRFSVKWAMVTALVLMVVGTFLTGFAAGLPMLVAGAVVVGAGAGTAMVTGAQGVALVLDHDKLARGLGVYGLVAMAASAIGAPVGVQLSLGFSTVVFAYCGAVVLVVAIAVMFTVPAGTGRVEQRKTLQVGKARAGIWTQWSARTRFVVAALMTAPWLIVIFLIISTVVMSHALTSLPVLAAALGNASVVVFSSQLGNAVGRGIGGELGTRLGTAESSIVGAVLILVGGGVGVAVASYPGLVTAGVFIGLGVGVIQSITLHAVMVRMTPGRASVLWNLGLDGGLWIGGILWGLLLVAGDVDAGVLVLVTVTAVLAAAVVLQLRSENKKARVQRAEMEQQG